MSGNIVDLNAIRENRDDHVMFEEIANQMAVAVRAYLLIAETRTASQLRSDLAIMVEMRRQADGPMTSAILHLAGIWSQELDARESGKPVTPRSPVDGDDTVPF